MTPLPTRILPILAVAAGLVAAAPAGAATVTRDGSGALVVTAEPGVADDVALSAPADDTDGYISLYDRAGLSSVTAEGCETPSTRLVTCRLDPAGVRVDLGDNSDTFTSDDVVLIHPLIVNGGAGNDKLDGTSAGDVLDGGDGNDTIDGSGGADVVRGGAGDDIVMGDHFRDPAADVIDGGPGNDTLQDDYVNSADGSKPPLTMTLGGGADDGRPGEGDDVENIETVVVSQGGTFTGTDGPEHFKAFQTTDPITMSGGGGNDDLESGGGPDTVDGGAGDDHIDAGYGDDKVTGGPGKDTIYADKQGGDCGPIWCIYPYGNDTVYAQDGEADSIYCGFGTDTVYADASDVVDGDCENVVRSGAGSGSQPSGPQGGGSTPSGPTIPSKPAARCHVPRVTGLALTKARRKIVAAGCRVRTSGHGRHVRRQSVRAGRTVARGTAVRLTLGR
jgi:Ca2+-binding RTX toxin-like protein